VNPHSWKIRKAAIATLPAVTPDDPSAQRCAVTFPVRHRRISPQGKVAH